MVPDDRARTQSSDNPAIVARSQYGAAVPICEGRQFAPSRPRCRAHAKRRQEPRLVLVQLCARHALGGSVLRAGNEHHAARQGQCRSNRATHPGRLLLFSNAEWPPGRNPETPGNHQDESGSSTVATRRAEPAPSAVRGCPQNSEGTHATPRPQFHVLQGRPSTPARGHRFHNRGTRLGMRIAMLLGEWRIECARWMRASQSSS